MLANVGPRNAAPQPATVRSWVYVYVDNVDEPFERARTAGAMIVSEPEGQPHGARMCFAVDPEGHEWYFAQHLRDVTVEDLEAMFRGQP